MPYILVGLFATNLGQAWRMTLNVDASKRFLVLLSALQIAFDTPLPSLYPFDILVGIICGAGLRLAVYLKSKNAKKYVLQTIGRGVRIEPFSNLRKRMRYCEMYEYNTRQTLNNLACGLETLFILASDNEAIKYILEEIESFITQYPLKGFKKTNTLSPLPTPKYKNTESKERRYKSFS